MTPSITTEHLAKRFSIGSPRQTLRNLFSPKASRQPGHRQDLYALHDITITIMRGEKIGIIGNNGAGKTTLLKTIAGLYTPSAGTIHTTSRMTLLSGIGAGMAGDLSVEENLFLYGAMEAAVSE